MPPPPITAAHGADIIALGVTPDGDAAATADRLGSIRLWTVLDGTREPIVIHGTAPRAIALARDGDGHAIVTLDDAGGVHMMRTSAAGAVRDRISVGAERALEIDATRAGFVVLRADQTIELVDTAGQVRARLNPDSGTHVDSIVVRGRRVLALVQADKRLHGRWIELDRGMRWGESTPKLAGKIAHAVLSPAGDVLAVTRPRSLQPVLIDLGTGVARKTPLCVAKGWPNEGGGRLDLTEFLRGDNAPQPLGFVTSTIVACSVMGALTWWTTDGEPYSHFAGTLPVRAAPVAISDAALVVGLGPNLGVATPTASRFLGYGLHDVAQLRVGPGGVLITGSDQQSFVLDATLRERARYDLGNGRVDWSDAVLLDDRYAITASPRRKPDLRNELVQLAVFDGVTRSYHQVLPYEMRDKELSYEASTRLLAASDGAASLLLRFDPLTHTLGQPTRIASWIPPTRLAVLDPAQARGVAALEIHDAGSYVLVGELHLDDLTPGATIQPRESYRVPGELRAVDRAGRLYMHGKDDGDDVVVYTRGAPGARLRGVAAMTLVPSADGAQIAAFQSPRLVMLGASGQVRWETAHWNSAGVAWVAGELLVRFPSGLARVDLATGALAIRQCGWGFGLSEIMLIPGHNSPSVCEVAR